MTSTGHKAITIEDVARRAGVSVATVSRALRNLPNVAPSTRLRVEQAALELHYTADPTASRLAAGKTSTVAVAVPTLDQWYFARLVAGVEAVLRQQGLDLLLYSVPTEVDRKRFFQGRGAWWRRGDGLILVDVPLEAEKGEGSVNANRASIVTIGSRTARFPSVTIDDRAAARRAVEHLLDRGHRRLGLISGDPRGELSEVASLRRQGYLEALAAAGLQAEPAMEAAGGFTVQGGCVAMARLLDDPDPPTAVFAISDEMAFGAIGEVRRRGGQVPGDVAVVGFDDHDLAVVFDLTTVRQEVDQVGATAAQLLLASLAGIAPLDHLVVPTALVVRASSG